MGRLTHMQCQALSRPTVGWRCTWSTA